MPSFWKIEKLNQYSGAVILKNNFKELKHLDTYDISDILQDKGLYIMQERIVTKPWWIRLTLPFGLILFLILLVVLPFKFMITGNWKYKLKWVQNWFNALGF